MELSHTATLQAVMLKARTFVRLLVGFAFLLQGFAVSASPLQHLASMEMSSMEGMHCHMGADSTPAPQKSCCDQVCPDMVSCFASVAAVTPASLLVVPVMVVESTAYPPGEAPVGTLNFLLRPPISLPG